MVFSLFSFLLTFYCKFFGTDLLEGVTKNLLENDVFPDGLDKKKLVDKTLQKSDVAIKCSID